MQALAKSLVCGLCPKQCFLPVTAEEARPPEMPPPERPPLQSQGVPPTVPYLFRCLRWEELGPVRDQKRGILPKGNDQEITLEMHLIAPRGGSPFVSTFGAEERPVVWAFKRSRDDQIPVRHPFPIAVIHSQRLVNSGSLIFDVSTEEGLKSNNIQDPTARFNAGNSAEFTVKGVIPWWAIVGVVRLACERCQGPCRSENGWAP
jgi:hypothetical protein